QRPVKVVERRQEVKRQPFAAVLLLDLALAAVALVGVFEVGLGLAQEREILIALALRVLRPLLKLGVGLDVDDRFVILRREIRHALTLLLIAAEVIADLVEE